MLTRTIKYLLWGMTCCLCHLTMLAQNRNIDSLLTLVKTDKPDTNKVNNLNKLSREFIIIGLYDTSLYHSNAALQLAQQLNFKKGIANVYSNFGVVYYYKGDFSKTLEYWLKALKEEEELKDKKGVLKQLSNIGLIYVAQGDYPKALDVSFKTLKANEELKNISGIANDLANIGLIYQKQGDYPKALDYYLKALKMGAEVSAKNKIAQWLSNIGGIYEAQAEKLQNPIQGGALFNKALDYYFKALKMAEKFDDKNLITQILSNIGSVYDQQKDHPKALAYYFKALKIAEEQGNKPNIAGIYSNIGSSYLFSKKYIEAEKYLLDALKLATETGMINDERQFEELLSGLYERTGREKFALEHYKKAVALKDTIFSQENKKQLVRKEMNYEFDKKETAAKALQDKKDAVTAAEKQKQKVIIYSVSIGLFLVVLLALFILRGYRQKRKANIIITQQKAEVEKQKELVEEKNKEITDSINYANRIQQAKLPKKEEIYTALPQCFILFKPKDIVSGDFYFFHKNEKSVFIAAADCTGHGVPGAFMSMIGSEKLEDAVSQTTDTSEILKLLNIGIKTALHQSDISESTRDGMDIALCSIDKENSIVKYAGANRPIWIIRKGMTEVEETKATKKAIGGFTEDDQFFDTHELKLQQGDTLYIFTDGYADQFGGENGKKLMTKKFKEILLYIQDKTLPEQETYLDTFADNWRGNREQIDDILIIGVRL